MKLVQHGRNPTKRKKAPSPSTPPSPSPSHRIPKRHSQRYCHSHLYFPSTSPSSSTCPSASPSSCSSPPRLVPCSLLGTRSTASLLAVPPPALRLLQPQPCEGNERGCLLIGQPTQRPAEVGAFWRRTRCLVYRATVPTTDGGGGLFGIGSDVAVSDRPAFSQTVKHTTLTIVCSNPG